MSLWNQKDLEPPPTTTHKYTFIGVHDLNHYFNEAVQYFGNQNLLEKEAALLSRCIYRMKTKFRSDKGLKSMEKLNHTLLQYNSLQFHNVIANFFSLLPKNVSGNTYLPSRNMLDYILVRLQGVAHLMYRSTETATIMASNMGSRICIGHFWKVALIMLGIASRIWMISKDILIQCCTFYENILPMRKLLKNTGNNWLPEGYIYPDNLETWIGIDTNDINIPSAFKSLESYCPPSVDITDNSDVEETEEYIHIKDDDDEVINLTEDNKVTDAKFVKPSMFEVLTHNEDLGEVICKEVMNPAPKKIMPKANVIHRDSDDSMLKDNFNSSNPIGKKRKKSMKGKLKDQNKETLENHTNSYSEFASGNIASTYKESSQIKKDTQTTKGSNLCMNMKGKLKYHKESSQIKKDKQKTKGSNTQILQLNSIRDLKIFMKKESRKRENGTSLLFKKVDKLKWNMLSNHVKKLIKKVDKNVTTDTDCLKEVKNLLKASLK